MLAVSYQWDAVGNRTAVTNNGTGTSYTANNLNQYTAVGSDSPTFDNRGNLVMQNGWTYTFDAQNRLLTATNNTTTSSFSYDARNRCVSRTINGVTTLLFYDNWNLIEEWTTGGSQVAHYVHGPRMDELLVKVSTTNAVYYHHDALGNTTYLTGTNGAVVEKYTYDIFGAVTIKDSGGNTLGATAYANRFLFTGREWLAEISLYDYRNRVYSADLGRFLQTDPIRFAAGDVDLYRYVGNNPVSWVDPYGLQAGNPCESNGSTAVGTIPCREKLHFKGPYVCKLVKDEPYYPPWTLINHRCTYLCVNNIQNPTVIFVEVRPSIFKCKKNIIIWIPYTSNE